MIRLLPAFVSFGALCACFSQPPSSSDDSCDISTTDKRRELAADAEVDCELSISDTPFTDLSDFDGLRSVAGLWMNRNPQLVDISGLAALTSVPGSVVVRQHALLQEVRLDALVETTEVSFDCMPSLTSASLAALSTLETLNIEEVGPVQFEEFGPTTRIARLEIWQTGIRDLSFLAGVTSIDIVIIKDNPELPSSSVDVLLAQLETAPTTIEVCGNGTTESCSPETINETENCLSSE